MIACAILLCLSFGPEPIPLAGAVPNNTFDRGSSWNSRPWRQTLYWRGNGGILWCDDPDCLWCADAVYGRNQWPDPPIRIRR